MLNDKNGGVAAPAVSRLLIGGDLQDNCTLVIKAGQGRGLQGVGKQGTGESSSPFRYEIKQAHPSANSASGKGQGSESLLRQASDAMET
jgi:hypothetical protein